MVTISTATAHLAGALGKTVLLMLPHSQGRYWHWQAEREDSLWYPQMRLLRQSRAGDWAGVVQKVRDELVARMPARPKTAPRKKAVSAPRKAAAKNPPRRNAKSSVFQSAT